MKDSVERMDVPIVCCRCHGIYTYNMLKKFGEKRKNSNHSDVCNTCLTDEEVKELIENLGCTEADIFNLINTDQDASK